MIRKVLDRFFNARRAGVHQLSHATRYDRYPELFSAARELTTIPHPRILSFGCSSGEETASLCEYFADATVIGADISDAVLRKAAKRCHGLPGVSFVNTGITPLTELEPFDLIFAMSVLCRHKETKAAQNCSAIYPFRNFESTCQDLADRLRPGGLLVIYNANYRFTDTAAARNFTALEIPAVVDAGFVARFDPSGDRLEDDYRYCVFRKN